MINLLKKFSVFIFASLLLHSNNALAHTGYFFDLYCKDQNGQTSAYVCKPAIEGNWEIYGGSYNYQYTTPRYGTVEEVSNDMAAYIDSHFNICKPTSVAPYGNLIPNINNDGLFAYTYEMNISVGFLYGDVCETLAGTYANAYQHEKRFHCESGEQGPYKAEDDDYRFCVRPQKFSIEISGPSETQSLPALVGPITQIVNLTGENGSAKKWSVSIKMTDSTGAVSYTGGLTDEQGIYEFTYVPPLLRRTIVKVDASCDLCESNASKTISVIPSDASPNGDPQMCMR